MPSRRFSSGILILLSCLLVALLASQLQRLLPSMYARLLRPISARLNTSSILAKTKTLSLILSTSTPLISTFSTTTTTSKMSSNQQAPPAPKALTSLPFIDAIKLRRSIYALNSTSPISNDKITQIVQDTILHVPSSFNSQSSRLLVLLGDDHRKFWDMAMSCHHEAAAGDEAKWERTKPRMEGLKKAYGTIVFYEDAATVRQFQDKFPPYRGVFPEWSVQSGGMHQFVLWTALEAEGLGANLQHYQVVESVSKKAAEMWGIDKDWDMAAQLVFGGVEEGGRPTEPKEKKSTDETVKVFGA